MNTNTVATWVGIVSGLLGIIGFFFAVVAFRWKMQDRRDQTTSSSSNSSPPQPRPSRSSLPPVDWIDFGKCMLGSVLIMVVIGVPFFYLSSVGVQYVENSRKPPRVTLTEKQKREGYLKGITRDREEIREGSNLPLSWFNLAIRLQEVGKNKEAIQAHEKFVSLAAKDTRKKNYERFMRISKERLAVLKAKNSHFKAGSSKRTKTPRS